jgi:hypothetical protein
MMVWKDMIVEEVQAIRRKIVAECQNDPKRLLARERQVLRRWKGQVVTKDDLDRAKKHSGRAGK